MITLHYKEYGSGNNYLLILHGFLGSLDNWHSLAAEWGRQGLHVFAIDQRNHGRSPHTDTHTIDDMVQDLAGFMKQHTIGRANVLGHSMGGKVAMQFALTYPGSVNRLIVADMAPRAYRPGAHDDVFRAINHVDLSTALLRKDVDEAMSRYLGDHGTRQFVMKSLDRVEEGRYRWKFNLPVLQRDYGHIIGEVDSGRPFEGPTLFIRGAQSLYVQEKDRDLIGRLFTDYRIETIEGAGHWLHAEKPAVFSEKVMDFIRG